MISSETVMELWCSTVVWSVARPCESASLIDDRSESTGINAQNRLSDANCQQSTLVCTAAHRQSEEHSGCTSGIFEGWRECDLHGNVDLPQLNSEIWGNDDLENRYQCSFATFHRANPEYDHPIATRYMREAVRIACQAKTQFCAEEDVRPENIRIALSLGPFGALLEGAREYDGFYPAPYGPPTPMSHLFDDMAQERAAEDALLAFHLERLRVFAEDEETWGMIDIIAFETIPVLWEVRAIKRAMAGLTREGKERKPWWISLVFPGGRFPQESEGMLGERVGARHAAMHMLEDMDNGEAPGAIGINCTKPEFFSELLDGMEEVLRERQTIPWLVIYPDGHGLFDAATQTYEADPEPDAWVDDVVRIVDERTPGRWAGLIVGGCCSAGPSHISRLSARFNHARYFASGANPEK
jgi:homocysteine S-methyltransferase